jgi:hypothetical protein
MQCAAMKSLTLRGQSPDLNIYGDVDAAMDVDVSTAQRVPFDWFDGNESDDEINEVTGQCESSNPTARLEHHVHYSCNFPLCERVADGPS